MNRLLRSQLRKFFGHGAFDPGQTRGFLDAVNAAYNEADEHSRQLVRSVELTSEELVERNNELRARNARLQKLSEPLVEMARSVMGGWIDPTPHIHNITETCRRALDVDRVSLWAYEGDRLRCLDLCKQGQHSDGGELFERDFPAYFAAIRSQRSVSVDEAQRDPRTREFADSYLIPLGITSMLDAGVSVGPELRGVLCIEHVGPPRRWTAEEIAFAGSVADLVALVFETRRRRDAERELDQQRTFLRQVIDLIPNLIFAKDRDGRFVLINDATASVYGTTVADMLGKRDSSYISDVAQCARTREIDAAVMATGSEHVCDEQITDASGQQRWFRTVRRSVIAADGQATMVLGVATDFTDQRAAEAARARLEANLRQAQKIESLGLLAGGIAHDLNNILTPILMTASMALEELDPIAPLYAEMNDVLAAAQSARELTGQLLAFGRKQVLCLTTIDSNLVIVKTVKMISRLVPARIKVHLDLCDRAMVRADEAQIQQVILNLVMNACDAMTAEGTITLTTRCEHDSVVMQVADTGVGMPEEIIGQVFDPFFTTKELGRGTGLGLATVHGIVQQHNGTIEVRSRVGYGTVFQIVLPRSERRSSPMAVQASEPLVGSGTILLVEDESPIRRLVHRVLAKQGYTILEAEHSEAALAMVASFTNPIDLLLTDVVLPGMSGPALFNQLRETVVNRVIYMSGHARDAFEPSTLRPGLPFLRKPFTANDLSTMVCNAMARNTGTGATGAGLPLR